MEQLLPDEHPISLYSVPGMSEEGVTFYYNEYESETRRAYTESFLLTFAQLDSVLNKQSDCYQALHTPYIRSETTVAGFSDVQATHWAAGYILTVADKGPMQGSGGLFRP